MTALRTMASLSVLIALGTASVSAGTPEQDRDERAKLFKPNICVRILARIQNRIRKITESRSSPMARGPQKPILVNFREIEVLLKSLKTGEAFYLPFWGNELIGYHGNLFLDLNSVDVPRFAPENGLYLITPNTKLEEHDFAGSLSFQKILPPPSPLNPFERLLESTWSPLELRKEGLRLNLWDKLGASATSLRAGKITMLPKEVAQELDRIVAETTKKPNRDDPEAVRKAVENYLGVDSTFFQSGGVATHFTGGQDIYLSNTAGTLSRYAPVIATATALGISLFTTWPFGINHPDVKITLSPARAVTMLPTLYRWMKMEDAPGHEAADFFYMLRANADWRFWNDPSSRYDDTAVPLRHYRMSSNVPVTSSPFSITNGSGDYNSDLIYISNSQYLNVISERVTEFGNMEADYNRITKSAAELKKIFFHPKVGTFVTPTQAKYYQSLYASVPMEKEVADQIKQRATRDPVSNAERLIPSQTPLSEHRARMIDIDVLAPFLSAKDLADLKTKSLAASSDFIPWLLFQPESQAHDEWPLWVRALQQNGYKDEVDTLFKFNPKAAERFQNAHLP